MESFGLVAISEAEAICQATTNQDECQVDNCLTCQLGNTGSCQTCLEGFNLSLTTPSPESTGEGTISGDTTAQVGVCVAFTGDSCEVEGC